MKKQERQEADGGVGVSWNEDSTLTIEATHDGIFSSFCVTEWNALRILGSLALLLKVSLAKAVEASMKKLKRQEEDGAVAVTRCKDGTFIFEATHDKRPRAFRVTEWNARRLLGSLALVLGVKLPKNVKIEMGTVTAKYVPEKPLQTLGERVAWHMGMQAMAKKTKAKILEPPKSTEKVTKKGKKKS